MTAETPADTLVADQLILELYVRDTHEAAVFYEALGFERGHADHNFIVLHWNQSGGNRAMIYLESVDNPPAAPRDIIGNIRILVEDVDKYWDLAQSLSVPVFRPIADRSYNLRDFTIISPDGIGLRFGTRI